MARYANCALVLAVTDKEKGTRGGISGFVVETGTKGFRSGKKENKLGLRASDTAELIFEDCEIPAENLIGKEGEGFKDAMRVLDGGRISIAALSLGMARGALDAAVTYAQERRQFGKAISEFQAIQFKFADMATELDAAWLLTMRAAHMKDAGQRVTKESAMAKLYASEAACRICDAGVQIHGGYGFIKDYPAEKFYRDVRLCPIGEGTSEIQRMVIARELLGKVPSRGIECLETRDRRARRAERFCRGSACDLRGEENRGGRGRVRPLCVGEVFEADGPVGSPHQAARAECVVQALYLCGGVGVRVGLL